MITILEAAESYDFDTLTNVKALLGIPGSGDDELVSLLISAASSVISEYTQRSFAREHLSETVAGYNDVNIALSRAPIESVVSVLHSGEPVVDYSIEKPESGMLFREAGWDWTVGRWWSSTSHPAAGTEAPKFTVDYWAGYWLPSFTGAKPATATALPSSLHLVFIELVGFWYNEQKQKLQGVDSLRIGDYQVGYSTGKVTSTGIPNGILTKLQPWVRIE